MTWERFVRDAMFPERRKHGTTLVKVVRRLVDSIHSAYRGDAPIMIRVASGFTPGEVKTMLHDNPAAYLYE